MIPSTSSRLFKLLGVAPSTIPALEAMVSLYIACLNGFISVASMLNVAPQGSIATFPDASTSSSKPFELLFPSNQTIPWPNNSVTPADPPPLPANISALQALGMDADEPISWETTPSGNVMGIQCNIGYGRRLDFQDCRDAYNYIPRSDERVARFVQRHSGLPHDIVLPQRVLGSTSALTSRFLPFAHYYRGQREPSLIVETGKGKCGINLAIIAPYETARASAKDTADAAYALIDRCAPRSGGIAINIGQYKSKEDIQNKMVLKAGLGGDNHLAVILQPYASTIRCEGPVIPFSRHSCEMIERGMEAGDRQRLFGDQRLDPQVQEPLPYELLSSKGPHSARLTFESLC